MKIREQLEILISNSNVITNQLELKLEKVEDELVVSIIELESSKAIIEVKDSVKNVTYLTEAGCYELLCSKLAMQLLAQGIQSLR